MTLDYYIPPIKTSEGYYSKFVEIAQKHGFNVRKVDVADANQLTFIRSCTECDVVFVDATIPPDGKMPSVYPCLVPDVNFLDHIFVFSDNRFPLNIVPHSGWSRYDVNDRVNKTDPATTIDTYLKRIKEEIVTGRHYPRIKVVDDEDVAPLMKALGDVREKAMEYAKKRENSHPQKTDSMTHIFISYRAKKSNGDGNYEEVVKFAERKKGEGYVVDFVQTEELSAQSELMSPMRKWFLLNQLADRIMCADEFWIYKTDNYLGSWWTIGELILVSYLNQGFSRQGRKIKIMLHDPVADEDEPATEDYYVGDEQLFKRLARYLSYTNPKSMGPESRKTLGLQKLIYEAAKDNPSILDEMKAFMRQQFEAIIAIEGEKVVSKGMIADMLEEMSSADRMLARLDDDVNQDVFWDGLTMQLSITTKAVRCNYDTERTIREIDKLIDYDMFLRLPMLEVVNVSASEMQGIAADGIEIDLLNGVESNPVKKRVSKAPDRYMWLATRAMRPIKGTFALGLDRVDSFRAEDSELCKY